MYVDVVLLQEIGALRPPHLSDIVVLDYVLANPDRRLDKNTYVAGVDRMPVQRALFFRYFVKMNQGWP